MTEFDAALVWFRRDLRTDDHAALSAALRAARRVHCVFVFDREILDALPEHADRRVEFIWHSVAELREELRRLGGDLLVRHGHAREEIPRLATALRVAAVFANHDYEPQAIARDATVAGALAAHGIALRTFKDQAIFDKDELLTQDDRPFSVFTPYRTAWLRRVTEADVTAHPVVPFTARLAPADASAAALTLAALGFLPTNLADLPLPAGMSGAETFLADFLGRIERYHEHRDFPALRGPSYLSVHLRFGTISVRRLVRLALEIGGRGPETWLSELVWRDFYFQILWHHPHVVERAFRPEYGAIAWPNPSGHLEAWQQGRTGYPLVDAAMRQINMSGYMHNRLRMVAASFLVKDLHVDWRLGERYFADRLNDFDLAANNGGWQWAASTGCDAQPYFRIFNPVTQSARFDPTGRFIRKYLPQLAAVPDRFIHAPWRMSESEQRACGMVIGRDYPPPIVDHDVARRGALELFGRIGRRARAQVSKT
ncbi:MAG: deoxyribodipyrimidine photo-lyase [Burkholderiales bacterium]